jgi:hypothetical protein
VSAQTWWGIYSDIAGLVLDKAGVTAIFAEVTSWTNVSKELAQVTSCSLIGAKMFGFANALVISERVCTAIDAKLALIKDEITVAVRTKFFDECIFVGESLHVSKLLVDRRAIKLSCGGLPYEVQVADFGEEPCVGHTVCWRSLSLPLGSSALLCSALLCLTLL